MSHNHQLFKKINKFYRQLCKKLLFITKKQIIWLLRTFFAHKRRRSTVNAGFVLPTVAMVVLVVVLLTTAILFRSFDRSKNANNVRVNEVVLSAASPALERAKAKIDRLFSDPRLPRSTPSDLSLSQVIDDNINQYTFGDETQLKLVKEFNFQRDIQDEEISKTAWKYPVDTDNNGKIDSFTLYGIYFRTPTTNRSRSPLEARTQPMDEGASGGLCKSNVATSANLIGNQGWYKIGSQLKRSIFVYTTTVPITVEPTSTTFGDNYTKYEKFIGNKGFAAIEYQQDRARIPLNNNAVLFENDLEIAPGFGLQLNGRVFTNGNLLTRKKGNDIRFYLVSSPKSCYYTEENSKIVVAGNVINSKVTESSRQGDDVKVDLFDQKYDFSASPAVGAVTTLNTQSINDTQKTVLQSIYGNKAAYNDAAYASRIDRLVDQTIKTFPNKTDLPVEEVQKEIETKQAADHTLTYAAARDEQLRIYFKQRTRRVPYAEIPVDKDAIKDGSKDYSTNTPLLRENQNALRPVDDWAFPYNPGDGTTATGYAEIGINPNNTKLYLSATDPAVQVTLGKEQEIGDRVLVGNNLPQYWYDSTKGKFVSSEQGQTISGKEWNNNTNPRQRFTQAYQLDDLGNTGRGDFWEKSAAQKPQNSLDIVGGLRVVTGAGIYLPKDYDPSTHTFTQTRTIVWPDSMPMGITTQADGLPDDKTPYLQMRATAVYHYKDSSYDPTTPGTYQTPIACVSSYYDPTNSITAKNVSKDKGNNNLPDVSPYRDLTGLPNTTNPGKSNNGVVYSASSLSTSSYTAELNYQANLTYPNGRLVNEKLSQAMKDINNSQNLNLAEQSAVDSAICALKILDGTIGAPIDTAVPHGAIMETAFLDARQIKAIDKPISTSSTKYDLDVELRQPLEIRATVIDLDLLRKKSKADGEFLFPNGGIIYATRDDALADASNTSNDVSATDFKLDPTRRPNGIMLINGSDLSRNDTYKAEEKGLILASDLPVYIQGDFNIHKQEEFTDHSLKGVTDWSNNFYKRQILNTQFACRKNQFDSCTTGETWRSATVLADAITILSQNFQLGFREEGDYGLRDNYGNFPIGYDLDGDGIIGIIPITLNEKAINFDLNSDGNITDNVSTLDEPTIGVDLNNNGNNTDINVPITERNITATVAARLNGFWDNNFVTSRKFTDSQYSGSTTGRLDSSYFNNFVTPIQRRVSFSEYVMEICPKLTVTACTPNDWVVGYDLDGDGHFNDAENGIKANQLIKALADAKAAKASFTFDPNNLRAGTTALAAKDSDDQRYPRRVAFLRHTTGQTVIRKKTGSPDSSITVTPPIENKLVLDFDDNTPVPLGIFDKSGNPEVRYVPFSNTIRINETDSDYPPYSSTDATKRPRTQSNALWFKTFKPAPSTVPDNYDPKYALAWVNDLTGTRPTEQPLLVPVLQIQYPFISPSDTGTLPSIPNDDVRKYGNWMQTARDTETNLVFAQGNTPGRPVESNGGLENFVRYLERWQKGPNDSDIVNHTVAGAFIQFKRSSYATAPFQAFADNPSYGDVYKGYSASKTIFGYPQGYRLTVGDLHGNTLGSSPFYAAPKRFWGYDVALLSQLPDLFSQRFTSPSAGKPNEFYREVGRDDLWVKTLLCAAQNTTYGHGTAASGYGTGFQYAISQDQRGTCP